MWEESGGLVDVERMRSDGAGLGHGVYNSSCGRLNGKRIT